MACVSLLAALPSIAAGLVGGGFLTDDWAVWLMFDRLGVLDGMWHLAFEQPARPLVAPYYAFVYLVVGDSPVIQGLLLGGANALVLVSAWACGRRFVPARILGPSLVVFAIAPSHAMTRLWTIVATYPMAMALVLLGVREVDRGRLVRGAAFLAAATLLYEGSVGLGLGLLGLWALADLRGRLPPAVLVAVPTVAAAVFAYAVSPKRDLGPQPLNNLGTLYPGNLGVGLWGSSTVTVVAGVALMLGLVAALAQLLPSWRTERPEGRWALLGVVLFLAGASPFLASGAPFATTGLFDRNNAAPAVGVALLLGSLWSMLARRAAPLATAVGVTLVVWFAILQVEDVANYADAVERGDDVVAALAAGPGIDDSAPILVVPAQESAGTGLADFVYDGDLVGALRYRHGGNWSGIRLVENAKCEQLAATVTELQVWDWTTSTLSVVRGDRVRAACEIGRQASRHQAD